MKKNQNHLREHLAPYEKANTKKSVWQIFNTLVPFFLLWVLAYQSLSISYGLTFVFCIIAAGFLVRIFILFHDSCHHSFFKHRLANRIIGIVTGILTMTPYDQWQRSHSIHHATSSNLNKRGIGDVWVLTVDEYVLLPLWRKIAYRLYRNPFVMFVLGPIYIFLIAYRFNTKGARRKERFNTYFTNVSIATIIGLLCWAIGWQAFLMIQGPIFLLSSSLGIWLFYVQHQFEHTYFENETEWDYVKAALDGSSYYKLPKVLQWLTGNIGFHHIHHLSPRIPNYYLEEIHSNYLSTQNVPTITLLSSVRSLHFRLWDEQTKQLIGFKELKDLSSKRKYVSAHVKSVLK